MRHPNLISQLTGIVVLIALPVLTGSAQSPAQRPWCDNVVIPQTYRSAVAGNYRIQVTAVVADVSIVEQVATTRMDISLKNTSGTDQTAELLIPVPADAAIKSFTLQGNATEQKTDLLTKRDARTTFDSIVARLKDPALLEFAGFNLLRTSVFPVPAQGDHKIRIVYEHLLKAEGDRVDYVLPRSGSVVYDTPWKISVNIKSKRPITTVYSPSHQLTTSPVNKNAVTASVAENATSTPGPFNLSYLLENGAMSASMFTHPDADGKGGYFLLLAGMGEAEPEEAKNIEREITLVIDRSGSMSGKKIEQAKESALQVIEGLKTGESFNIITYSDEVEVFSEHAVVKSKETIDNARSFIEAIVARGGTNLHEALLRSLQNKADKEKLAIVMFLTDGLPTVGETSEAAIRKVAVDQNPHERRIFSFGLGYDVNTPLLDKIATSTRGFATFVLPSEDVEAKVARVFRGLDGPTLASPKLRIVNAKGKPTPNRVMSLLPNEIPDMYEGDQLVLLGRYQGRQPLFFELTGNYRGKPQSFNFNFDVKPTMKTNNAFVARLWASRRIAQLVDTIRDLGANPGELAGGQLPGSNGLAGTLTSTSATPQLDSQLKELTDEIIQLSKEFGILTEYTSFLAEDGIDLGDAQAIHEQAIGILKNRALDCRTGIGAVNQEFNNAFQRGQSCANPDNRYWTADMKQATITSVQQCNVGAFYRRGNRWISNRLIDEEKKITPDRTVEFGTPEYNELVWQLVTESRNNELALDGDILINVGDEKVLIKGVTQDKPNESQPEK
jgi:Ca-activated chloride channel family protein